jgi:hypothetical protein
MDVRAIFNLHGIVRRLDKPPELALDIVFRNINPAVVCGSSRRSAIHHIRRRRMSFKPHPFKVPCTTLEAGKTVILSFIKAIIRVEQARMAEPLALWY